MSSGITSYAAPKLLDNVLRAQANALPVTLLLRLNSTASTHTTSGTELTGNAYARTAVTMAASSDDNTKGTISNTAAVQFPTPTPSGWTQAVSFDILDQAGNRWFWGDLTANVTAAAGVPVVFPIGSIVVNAQ